MLGSNDEILYRNGNEETTLIPSNRDASHNYNMRGRGEVRYKMCLLCNLIEIKFYKIVKIKLKAEGSSTELTMFFVDLVIVTRKLAL